MTLHIVKRTTRLLPVIAVAAVLSGCVAIKEPALCGPEPANRVPGSFVVGVRDPAIRVASDASLGVDASPTHSELYCSTRLIQRLRATGLFSEVNFVEQLARQPDVVLSAHLKPPLHEPTRMDGYWLLAFYLSLGMIPTYGEFDDGVDFSRIDQPRNIYSFAYRKMQVSGWVAMLFTPFPGWSSRNDQDRYNRSFRRFLLGNWDSVFTAESVSGQVTTNDTTTPNQALEATPLRGSPQR